VNPDGDDLCNCSESHSAILSDRMHLSDFAKIWVSLFSRMKQSSIGKADDDDTSTFHSMYNNKRTRSSRIAPETAIKHIRLPFVYALNNPNGIS
jgi:hypothetical protein